MDGHRWHKKPFVFKSDFSFDRKLVMPLDPPFPLPIELSTASKISITVARVLHGVSLVACVCSSWEQWEDWRLGKQHEKRHARTRQQGREFRPVEGSTSIITRLLFFQNISFVLFAVNSLVGSVAIPRNRTETQVYHTWGAQGNRLTCDVQGAVNSISFIATLCFDAFLSLAYFCMIHYGWNEAKLRSVERYVHMTTWPTAIIFMILGFVGKLYNPGLEKCHTVPLYVCSDLRDGLCYKTQLDKKVNEEAMYLFWALMFVFFVLHFIWSLYVMARIIKYTRNQSSSEVSQRVAIKASLFISVIVLSQLPLLLLVCLESTNMPTAQLNHAVNLALPFIGINNFFVFMWNRRTMRTSLGMALSSLATHLSSRVQWLKSTLGAKERRVEHQCYSPDMFADSELEAEDNSPSLRDKMSLPTISE